MGKDYGAIPSFVPVGFEVTVLLAAYGMVATFFVISNLKPYGKTQEFMIFEVQMIRHVMAIDLAKNKKTTRRIKYYPLLKDSGAVEINEKKF